MAQAVLATTGGSGAAVRGQVNAIFEALGSCSKGPTAPPSPLVGQVWVFDGDDPWLVRFYLGAAKGWVQLYTVSPTTGAVVFPSQTDGLLASANNLSDLANVTAARSALGLATVAATGAYDDLTGKPDLLRVKNNLSDLANVAAARSALGLATVAATGAYDDLVGKPAVTSGGLGVGQTVQEFALGTTRISGVTYTNTTGKTIFVSVAISSGAVSAVVDGMTVSNWAYHAAFPVPAGSSYAVTTAAASAKWTELR